MENFQLAPMAGISGTFRVGEVKTSYAQLRAVFGEPLRYVGTPGEKTTNEWIFRGPIGNVSIHDYDHDAQATPNTPYVWSINANRETAFPEFMAWLNKKLGRG